ncbi:AIR synthase family protein [Candidatus Lucifugimonas marina]|jgi:hydrogenase maturation factor|uniref:Hydrogenase expression protein n=1 Tax=Candidatus Lucifugimonas marina TaxID=3038979 RepID=A0AAJ5ZFR9_9CHLR|nr:hydrogenase expression protein [SAR202 cluster bacterium JH702]MDG0870824.1 hydrogenase expression protein [SAR202 cluster bacterium JH639]WFG36456.1 hydrogenase expression protein [SAR202 cluster bacterium JH545]WFG40389.1 hydrogenase expression protein [SAR202 cluster bacterium JH1073]
MSDELANRRLKAGKLPPDLLAGFIGDLNQNDKRLLLGPGVGEDAAFVSFGSSTLIAKSDPITFATDRIGWYAIQVNANDIAACGGTPKWFLGTLLLPENEPASTARDIFAQLNSAAAELGITLIGGHTEITVGISRPIISGTMLGEAAPSETVKTSSAQIDDDIILTSGIAIEGTAIIARESKQSLLEAGLSEGEIANAANFLDSPGISVVKAAKIASSTGHVTAMHDPTEGGLAGALDELARASNTGVSINSDQVKIYPETTKICEALNLDPWGLIASGALLITTNKTGSSKIISALNEAGIPSAVIGSITPVEEGLARISNGITEPFPMFERDEIARLYSQT